MLPLNRALFQGAGGVRGHLVGCGKSQLQLGTSPVGEPALRLPHLMFCTVRTWRSCARSLLAVSPWPIKATVCVGRWRWMFGVVLLYVR